MRRAVRSVSLPVLFGSAALVTFTGAPPAAAADGGELAYNNHCRTCHSLKADDNRLGPSLNKVFGRKAGGAPGYPNYSQAMASSGVTWDEATLDKFIENPNAVVANNNMKPYAGISDPAVRKGITAFLKSSSEGK